MHSQFMMHGQKNIKLNPWYYPPTTKPALLTRCYTKSVHYTVCILNSRCII